MCSKTTVAISSTFPKERMWLNGVEETLDNPRLRACIDESNKIPQTLSPNGSNVRSVLSVKLWIAVKRRAKQEGTLSDEELSWNLYICSENNFPTAAGLASSAAGYACLGNKTKHSIR